MDSAEAAEVIENQNEAATPRSCAICNATKTPLWRGGPAGPKSLCNACGIKYRKKSGDPPVWIAKEEMKSKANRRSKSAGGVSFKVRLSASNSDVLLQRLFLHNQKLPEEEEAAVLLMALSCGLCESKIQSFAQHL